MKYLEPNPVKTGNWAFKKPKITEKCVGCGTCTKFCPEGCIKIVEENGKRKAVIDYNYCKGCFICKRVCPLNAISEE